MTEARDIPLGDEAIAALEAERHLRGPLVFCDAGTDVEQQRGQASALAGLRQGRAPSDRLARPSARVRFAPRDAWGGGEVVQELLGHATIEMTMRYAHLSPDVPRHAVKLLDGLGSSAAPAPNAGRQVGDKGRFGT